MNTLKNSGGNVAAFFDIDGTLLALPSLERRFLSYLRWRGALTAARGVRWLKRFLWSAAAGVFHFPKNSAQSAWLAATEGNKAHLAGISVSIVEDFVTRFRRRPVEFFPEAVRRLKWHASKGHRIFLVSGTLEPLAAAVAAQLPVQAIICATQLEVVGDRWTGEVTGEAVCGPGKARAVERLAAAHQLDLARSYAYGDAWSDRWMLERVGYPAAVNFSPRLARLVRRRGWPTLLWRAANEPRTQRDAQGELPREEKDPWEKSTNLARSKGIAAVGKQS